MLHLLRKQEISMPLHDWDELAKVGIYDYTDIYTDEEIEAMRREKEEEQYNSPISMDSLGLSWRDFF